MSDPMSDAEFAEELEQWELEVLHDDELSENDRQSLIDLEADDE